MLFNRRSVLNGLSRMGVVILSMASFSSYGQLVQSTQTLSTQTTTQQSAARVNTGATSNTVDPRDFGYNDGSPVKTALLRPVNPPIVVCADKTVGVDANCQVSISGLALDGGSTDYAGGSNITFSYSPAGPFGIGVHQVTMTVTDQWGVSASCTAVLTVVDQTGPQLVTQDATVYLDANGQATISQSDVVVSVSDYCSSPVSVSLSKTVFNCSDAIPASSTNTSGTLSAMLTADNEFEFYISKDDNVQGTFVGSGNDWSTFYQQTASLDPNEDYFIHVKATDLGGPEFFAGIFNLTGDFHFANGTKQLMTNTSDWLVSATGWSNYVSPLLVGSPGLQPWGSGLDPLKPAQLIWQGVYNTTSGESKYFTAPIYADFKPSSVIITATDAAGNSFTGAADITVVDNIAPVVTTSPYTVHLDANGQGSIQASDVISATDNCGGNVNITLSQTSFDCSDIGTVTVNYTVSDNLNNSVSGTCTVVVEDNVNPTAIANNAIVNLDATGMGSITVSDIDAGSTDNCGVSSVSLSQTTFTCNDGGSVVPVTLTVVDASGNIGTAIAQITVNPVQPIAATDDVFNLTSAAPFTFSTADLIGNDVDPYGQTLKVDAVINPSSGTLVDNLNNTWTFTPASSANQTVTASYVVKRDDGTLVYGGNGHFYEFVSSPAITWSAAKVAAEQRVYNGMHGYLVTVTSAGEDAFVAQKLQGEGWMGASDSETENIWKWVTGPEAGTIFYNQATRQNVNGQYSHWGNGEPNDYKYGNPYHPGEDWAHYYPTGIWNDYPNYSSGIAGYIVEYGGMAGDCNTSASATANITFNVVDNTAPTVLTQNVTVALDANGQASVTAAMVDAGSSDASGIASMTLDVTNFNCNNVGANTVNLTVTDINGNSASASAVVTVEDNTAPVAVANSISVTLDVFGQASITVADIEGGSSDNCGIVSSSIDKTTFTCNDGGTIVPVTLSVVDAAGNLGTAVAQVTVIDVLPISANDDAFTMNSGTSFTFSAADLMGNDVDPYSQPLQVDAVVNPSSGTLVDNLNNTWTFTPASTAGQTVTASYVVKRNDGTLVYSGNGHFYEFVVAPQINWTNAKVAAENRRYNGMQGYLATITSAAEDAFVAQKLQGEGWIGASDAAVEGTWRWVTGPEAGTQFWQGLYNGYAVGGMYNHWAWGEPNNAGNEDYAHYWSNGQWNDYPVYAGGISGYIVEYGGMPGDCNTASTSTANITITVQDVTPPTVLAQNATVYLDANGQASATVATIDAGSSDASGIASMSLDVTSFDCSMTGANTVTLTAVDIYGNSASASAVVTVVDNTAPTATFTGGSISLTSNRTVTLDPATLVSNVADNCGTPSLAVLGQTTFDCSHVGQTFNTAVTVTDASGNVTTVSGQITIDDQFSYCNNPPVAVCTPGVVPANSNCEALVLAQAFNGGSYDPDGDPITMSIFPAGPFGLGTHAITLTVTDDEGASSSCTTTLTVTDQTGPVVVSQDITIALDAVGQANITPNDVVVSATDNCSPNVTLTLDQTAFDCNSVPAVNGTGGAGVLSSTLTADNTFNFYISTDDNVQGTFVGSGSNWAIPYNFTSNLPAGQTYYLHVEATDQGGPEMFLGKFQLSGGFQFANGTQTLVTNGADWKVSASGWSNYTNPLYLGNIGFGPWGYGLSSMAPAQFIWHGSYNTAGGETKYFTAPIYPTVTGSNVTITATDAAGNVTTTTAIVNVVDNMAPVVSVQGITVALDANGQASITAADIDNNSSDNCGIASYSLDVSSFTCADAGTTVPVTMTVTDASGNSSSATASVSVVDQVAPQLSVQNATVYLDANGAASVDASDVIVSATDACGIASAIIDLSTFDCSGVGAHTVTATATDAHGNVTTATATVTVVDAIAPTVSCQNITVDLPQSGSVSITADDVNVSSTDNCGIASMTVSPSTFDCANEGANTVVLTVTDVNGNVSTCTSVVTVVKSPLVVTEVLADYNGFGVSCFGSANGAIDLTVSGACEPYSYAWSNGASTEDVSGLAAGVYSVVVTDGNGQTYNYSYTITEPTLLTASKAMTPYQLVAGQMDSTIFLGYGPQSVTLDVTPAGGAGGYTYQWYPATGLSSTSSASVTASPMAPTTYTVVITDVNGCSIQRSINVNVVDARDPNNSGKVVLCHLHRKKGVLTWGIISVSVNAVPAHLGHGDYLGPCVESNKSDVSVAGNDVELMHTALYPNPTSDLSTLSIHAERDLDVVISVCDARGAIVSQVYSGTLTAEMEYEFNMSSNTLPAGMYNVIVRSEGGVQTIRWVVVR